MVVLLTAIVVTAALVLRTPSAGAHPSRASTLTIDLVLDGSGLVLVDAAAQRATTRDAPSPDERAAIAAEVLAALGVPPASAQVDAAQSALYHEVGFTITVQSGFSNTRVPGGLQFGTQGLQRVAAASVGNLHLDVCGTPSSSQVLTVDASAPSAPPDPAGARSATDRQDCESWTLGPESPPVTIAARVGLPNEDAAGVSEFGSLDCRDPIGGSATTPRRTVQPFRGVVALQTSASTRRALQIATFADPSAPDFGYWVKTPVYLRTNGKSATVVVPSGERGRIAMTWGNTDSDAVATRSFRVGPCAGSGYWVVFPGGYYVTEPDCYRLLVRVGGKEMRVQVGIGAPCPGQRPPPA
jgi:hypothetical protein